MQSVLPSSILAPAQLDCLSFLITFLQPNEPESECHHVNLFLFKISLISMEYGKHAEHCLINWEQHKQL